MSLRMQSFGWLLVSPWSDGALHCCCSCATSAWQGRRHWHGAQISRAHQKHLASLNRRRGCCKRGLTLLSQLRHHRRAGEAPLACSPSGAAPF